MRKVDIIRTTPRYLKLTFLCILAAGANFLLNTVSVYFLKIPLFLDTVFSVAVCFAFGLIPGLVTALLSFIAVSIRNSHFDLFIICALAEILIVWRLKPVLQVKQNLFYNGCNKKHNLNPISTDVKLTFYIRIFAKLMVIYIVCCFAVSILGGLIDYLFYTVLGNSKLYFSAEDAFKYGLLQGNNSLVLVNIFSRIPVNLVDRFIVIFGGYFAARGILRIDEGNSFYPL